ncbi:MAG: DUF3467 domain-containing protein [Myxococcota bacterium]
MVRAEVAMSEPSSKPGPVPIHVQLDDGKVEGAYVNMARIFHNQTEFVLDAMFLPPVSNTAKVLSRLVMSPVHAKQLLRALGHNVQLYEQKFGEIEVSPSGGSGGPGPGSIIN